MTFSFFYVNAIVLKAFVTTSHLFCWDQRLEQIFVATVFTRLVAGGKNFLRGPHFGCLKIKIALSDELGFLCINFFKYAHNATCLSFFYR